jgi:hypothetical protein
MGLQVISTCPLGHKCEEARDGAVYRCAWFVKLAGTNPSTGESIDEQGCAMHWTPVLLVENARTMRGTSAAVESFRNEMVGANQSALFALTSLPRTLIQEKQT